MAKVKLEKVCEECGVVSVLYFTEDGEDMRVTGTCCVHLKDELNDRIHQLAGDGVEDIGGYVVKRPVNPSLN